MRGAENEPTPKGRTKKIILWAVLGFVLFTSVFALLAPQDVAQTSRFKKITQDFKLTSTRPDASVFGQMELIDEDRLGWIDTYESQSASWAETKSDLDGLVADSFDWKIVGARLEGHNKYVVYAPQSSQLDSGTYRIELRHDEQSGHMLIRVSYKKTQSNLIKKIGSLLRSSFK